VSIAEERGCLLLPLDLPPGTEEGELAVDGNRRLMAESASNPRGIPCGKGFLVLAGRVAESHSLPHHI
jgi:hypothetical protein